MWHDPEVCGTVGGGARNDGALAGLFAIHACVVPDRYHVHTSTNLAIVEGNYMLLNTAGRPILPHFHLKIYIDAGPAAGYWAGWSTATCKAAATLTLPRTGCVAWICPTPASPKPATKANADVIIDRHVDEEIWRDLEERSAWQLKLAF